MIPLFSTRLSSPGTKFPQTRSLAQLASEPSITISHQGVTLQSHFIISLTILGVNTFGSLDEHATSMWKVLSMSSTTMPPRWQEGRFPALLDVPLRLHGTKTLAAFTYGFHSFSRCKVRTDRHGSGYSSTPKNARARSWTFMEECMTLIPPVSSTFELCHRQRRRRWRRNVV